MRDYLILDIPLFLSFKYLACFQTRLLSNIIMVFLFLAASHSIDGTSLASGSIWTLQNILKSKAEKKINFCIENRDVEIFADITQRIGKTSG